MFRHVEPVLELLGRMMTYLSSISVGVRSFVSFFLHRMQDVINKSTCWVICAFVLVDIRLQCQSKKHELHVSQKQKTWSVCTSFFFQKTCVIFICSKNCPLKSHTTLKSYTNFDKGLIAGLTKGFPNVHHLCVTSVFFFQPKIPRYDGKEGCYERFLDPRNGWGGVATRWGFGLVGRLVWSIWVEVVTMSLSNRDLSSDQLSLVICCIEGMKNYPVIWRL